jgi:outer membrane protein assembly factor BamB
MRSFVALLTFGLSVTAGLGADSPLAWPRFRGPGGSGVADGQKPPVELGPDKNVRWRISVPSGLSSPIVARDKLAITAFEGGKLYTIAYRRADGKEAWRAQAPAKQLEKYYAAEGSPAASTPATDGERIVSYFGSCGLFCYDRRKCRRRCCRPAATGVDFWTARRLRPPFSRAGQTPPE